MALPQPATGEDDPELVELKRRAKARRRLTEIRAEHDLGEFIPMVSPELRRPEHFRPLLDLFDRIARGERVQACISAPPQHGKTELNLHGAARMLKYQPWRTAAFATYASDFAKSKSSRARAIARAAGVKLAFDRDSLGEWRTTEGGGFVANGLGGLTGQRVDLMLVDDPYSDRAQAESETERERIWQDFTDVCYIRVQQTGSILVTHTRWHPDDIIGRLSTTPGWEVINLPAINPSTGAALCDWRFNLEALQRIRRTVGEYTWWSMYMGEPRPRGGRLFTEPERYSAPELDGRRIVISCDPAASESTRADYTAIVVWAFDGSGDDLRGDVIEVRRMQAEIPEVVATLKTISDIYAAPIVVEAHGVGKAVPQMLRAIDSELRLTGVTSTNDKFIRAQAVAAAWKTGRVRLPVRAPWLREYLNEMLAFTGVKDKHDDQVDATAHGWNWALLNEGYAPPGDEDQGKSDVVGRFGGF